MNSTKLEHLDNPLNVSRSGPQRHELSHLGRPVYSRSFHYLEEFYEDPQGFASVHVLTVNYMEKKEMNTKEEQVPMDVDEESPVRRSEWRSLRIKNRESKAPKPRPSPSNAQRVYLYTVPLITLVVALLYYLYEGASKDVAIADLKRELSDEVFEQEPSVRALVTSIEQYPLWPKKVKTLGFSGTRGVGKTHLANIARKHFSDSCVKDVPTKRLLEKGARKSIAASLSNHCLNLVIIDDLEYEHNRYVFEFINVIPGDRRALIIAIYNLYSDDDNLSLVGTLKDRSLITNDYERSDLYYELINFDRFDADQVKRWVEQQLQGMNITRRSQERIMQEVLLGHDADRYGLKGLHSKLMIEVQKETK